jgi:hypothetical protein
MPTFDYQPKPPERQRWSRAKFIIIVLTGAAVLTAIIVAVVRALFFPRYEYLLL